MNKKKILNILTLTLIINIIFFITASYVTGIAGYSYLIVISNDILNEAVTNRTDIEKRLYKIPFIIISKKKVYPQGYTGCDYEYLIEYSSIFAVKVIVYYSEEDKIVRVDTTF